MRPRDAGCRSTGTTLNKRVGESKNTAMKRGGGRAHLKVFSYSERGGNSDMHRSVKQVQQWWLLAFVASYMLKLTLRLSL